MIEKFKTWLVSKGYNQRPGLDNTQTFSPIVKIATIKVILTLAVMNGWPLRQIDVNNAFLNGALTKRCTCYNHWDSKNYPSLIMSIV